jgi:hypothetical protein
MTLKTFDNIINIRKLIALDISLNGWLPITAEFFFSFFGMITLLVLFESFLSIYLFSYLFLVSLNFIPPLIYALLIGNRQNAKKEARMELSKMKKYGSKSIHNYNLQQWFLVFIPFIMIILTVLQEIKKI